MSLSELLEDIWYSKHPLTYFLLPISYLYRLIIFVRKQMYKAGLLRINQFNIPIIVVGNIVAGGTGKSPLTIWLVDYLKQKNRQPGVISRGYGGKLNNNVQQVRVDSNPDLVGDEPIMIARRANCPIAIGKDRSKVAKGLLEHEDIDVIICDDGLQHYALGRDIEIAVVDGLRRHGNGFCIPAGPLREPISRLKNVDMVVANARAQRGEFLMEYVYDDLVSLINPSIKKSIQEFSEQTIHAVSGIGSPEKFYSYLIRHDLKLIRHKFTDHHRYEYKDLQFDDDCPIIMTEKDAIKCEAFATENIWYLPISAVLPDTFKHRLDIFLKEVGIG